MDKVFAQSGLRLLLENILIPDNAGAVNTPRVTVWEVKTWAIKR